MDVIKRELLVDLKGHLPSKEISLIVGPRQAGKTTLMLGLKAEVEKEGARTLYLSLDNEIDRQSFSSQDALMKKIGLNLGRDRGYLFIDEMQRKEDAGIFLKGIYDQGIPHKLIVSGSGSLELKEKIHESLIGRKRIFELGTITFDEFADFRTSYRYETRLGEFFVGDAISTEGLLSEYMRFGGYPRVILADTVDEKRRTIAELFSSYIEKDISFLLKVEKADAFVAMVRMLAAQSGQLVNYSELAGTSGVSAQTLKNYMWYGEKTFVFESLTPYHRNIRKEITKSPVIYFHDLGLRNYATASFGHDIPPSETGFIFQNVVHRIFKSALQDSGATLHFWRTKDQAEVDFVISAGKLTVPIEVKFKRMKRVEVGRSFRSFIDAYRPAQGLIVNLDLTAEAEIGSARVRCIPFWEIRSALKEL